MATSSLLCWGDDQHCLVSLTPGRFMNSQRFCDFLKDRIIVTGQWQNRKIAPLVVVHLLSNGCGPVFTLCGAKPTDERSKRELGELHQLHKEYQENDRVLIVAMGDDTEVVLAPINTSKDNDIDEDSMDSPTDGLPRFWGYALIRGALGDGADLLDSGRLPVILDLDETLVLAHTQSSLANRISALSADRLTTEEKIEATENEKQCMEKDLSLLKSFSEKDCIFVDGNKIAAVYEPVEGEDGKAVQRPIVRMTESCFFTRINPDRLETSMLIRIRPGWEDLKKYLAGEGSADKKQRFKISVCTAAERGYALEAWRLLDPSQDIIPQAQLSHRLICMGKQKKSLFRALQLGPWSRALVPQGCLCQGVNIGPLVEGASEMPLAVIVDDRSDVWEPRNHSQLVKVRPYLHYRDSIWSHRLPTDNDASELQKVQGLLQSARSNLYYELQEVLTPFVRKGLAVGAWDESSEEVLLTTMERISSLQVFLDQNYSRLSPPRLPPSWQIDMGPDISLCPQDPRDIVIRESKTPKLEPASNQSYNMSCSAIAVIPQRLGQESLRENLSNQPGTKLMAAAPPETYQCSMQPQDPRKEWKEKLEKSNRVQNQTSPASGSMGGGIPQKRKYDQVQSLGDAQPGGYDQGKVDGAGSRDPVVLDLTEDCLAGRGMQPEPDVRSTEPHAERNLVQGSWTSPDGFQGQMKGLTGRMGNFKMDAGNIMNPLPSFMGQVVAAPHQFQNTLSVQNAFHQNMPPGNGLQIQLGRGLTGVGHVLHSPQRPTGVQVYHPDAKGLKPAPAQGGLHKKHMQEQVNQTFSNSKRPRPSRGRKQVSNTADHVQHRNQAAVRPVIGNMRIQKPPSSVHPLTVQQIPGHQGQPSSILVQGMIGQMGLPQQGTPSQLKVAQVRVPTSTGLSPATQNPIPSYVVIKPPNQQQVSTTVQMQQFGKGLQQSIIAHPTGWRNQASVLNNPNPPSFLPNAPPGGVRQGYSFSHQGQPPPPQRPPHQPGAPSLQQNLHPSGMRGRALHDQPNLMQHSHGARGQGEIPRPLHSSSAVPSGRGAASTGSMHPRPPRYSDGPAHSLGGELNPISQLNQYAQKEKTELLFGARELENGFWSVTVSWNGVVKGVARCRNKRLGKRMASLLALEKLGAVRPREFEHRWRILSSEEDVVDEDKWTPCELLEGLYPGRVVYSDSADGPDRSRSFKAEVSVSSEDGESLKCEIDAWGMSKKKARNALANKMLRMRKIDAMVIDEDTNMFPRGFSSGSDDRPSKVGKTMPKGELNRDQSSDKQPGLRGYLAQLEDALDDGEAEEGEIQE